MEDKKLELDIYINDIPKLGLIPKEIVDSHISSLEENIIEWKISKKKDCVD